MKYELLDIRRFFRNRFESYVDRNDISGAYVNDGVPLNLRDICSMLDDDTELFPLTYDPDIQKLCGHEYLIWFRQARTYGDVSRLMTYLLNSREKGVLRPGGLWVSALLRGEEIPQTSQN